MATANLGGFDWDNRIDVVDQRPFTEAGGASLLDDPRAAQDLRDRCEQAKRTLSQMSTAKVVVSAGGLNRTVSITLEQFEDMTRDLLERTGVVDGGRPARTRADLGEHQQGPAGRRLDADEVRSRADRADDGHQAVPGAPS